jgi:hypothetical protein
MRIRSSGEARLQEEISESLKQGLEIDSVSRFWAVLRVRVKAHDSMRAPDSYDFRSDT